MTKSHADCLSNASQSVRTMNRAQRYFCLILANLLKWRTEIYAMPKDRDVLDVVESISRDLKDNESFCALLHKCDEETAQRLTKSFLEWLYRVLEMDKQPYH